MPEVNTPSTGELNPQQRRFVAEFLKDCHGTQAAIRAGYSQKTAASQASRLLRNAQIQAAIQQGLSKVERRAVIDAAYVLNGLKEVADRCRQKVPVMIRHGRGMVQKTEEDPETGEERGVWEFDSMGANKALELLGKHLALFTEKLEASGPGGGPLELVIRDLAKEE